MQRPTRKEMANLAESLDHPKFNLMLQMLRYTGSEDEQLPTAVALKMAFFDWMTTHNVLSDTDRQRSVMAMEGHLDAFARVYDRAELLDAEKPEVVQRPAAGIAILDFNFLTMPLEGNSDTGGFYDLKTATWIEVLPYHVLTSLSVDLSVLMLRLLGRMEKVRQLQERTNAAGTPGTTRQSVDERK